MGILDTLVLVTGIGLIGYVTYVSIGPTVFQRLIGYSTIPPAAAAPAAAPAPAPALLAPTPAPATITRRQQQQQQDDDEAPAPTISPASRLVPGTAEMTSPNVAGTAFTFNVVGDIDYYNGTGQNLCGSNPTLALIIGDFSYDCNAQKWWTTTMKACNGKNVIASVGNHDCSGKGFIDLWPANGGKWEFIKKVGNIAFIAVNTGYCSAQCSNPSTSEALFKQAQADPSVKFIVVHMHKPVFTAGTSPDAPMSYHTMFTRYSKVKMVFAGHNHTYKRYVPQNGIQYITAGRGGHDANGNEPETKGPSSNAVGVVKCRAGTDGSITCQYVANSGAILDQWGLTADGKHTGSGGVTPKQGSAPSEGASNYAYVQALYAAGFNPYYYGYLADKEERDNAIIQMMDARELKIHPKRKLNNQIYHYSAIRRRTRRRYG